MKRSEMVKKLMDTMGCYDSWEKQCSYMLEICEDEGMLCPSYEGLLSTGEKYDRNKHQGKDTGCFSQWEPE